MFLVVVVSMFAAVFAAPYNSIDHNTLEEDATVIDLSHFGNSIFGEPSNATGKLVASYDPHSSGLNPEELGEYLEGDMLMPQGLARNGLVAASSRWPAGVIPFEISGYFGMIFFPIRSN